MSAPLSNTVRERVEGTRRIYETEGWEWVVDPEALGDEEPRIADKDLAPRLGLALNDLRDLIRRHAKAANIAPFSNRRTVRRFTSKGQNRGTIEVTEYWLSEADALFLVTRSEAAGAIALTKAMIRVVLAVRRHLAQTVPVEAHTRKLPGRKALPAPEVTSRLTAEQTATLRAAAKRAGLSVEDFIDTAITTWIHDLAMHQRYASLAAKHHGAGPIRSVFVTLTEGLHEAIDGKARAILGDTSAEARGLAAYSLIEMGAHIQSAHDLAAYAPATR